MQAVLFSKYCKGNSDILLIKKGWTITKKYESWLCIQLLFSVNHWLSWFIWMAFRINRSNLWCVENRWVGGVGWSTVLDLASISFIKPELQYDLQLQSRLELRLSSSSQSNLTFSLEIIFEIIFPAILPDLNII